MSKHAERLVVHQELAQVYEACQEAVAQMGWRVLSQGGSAISLKEVASALSFTDPVTIEVRLLQSEQDTVVHMAGSNFGFGPIQSGHVKGQVGNLINRLHICLRQASQQKAQVPSKNLTVELEKIVALHRTGALTDTEFALAKQRLLDP